MRWLDSLSKLTTIQLMTKGTSLPIFHEYTHQHRCTPGVYDDVFLCECALLCVDGLHCVYECDCEHGCECVYDCGHGH